MPTTLTSEYLNNFTPEEINKMYSEYQNEFKKYVDDINLNMIQMNYEYLPHDVIERCRREIETDKVLITELKAKINFIEEYAKVNKITLTMPEEKLKR